MGIFDRWFRRTDPAVHNAPMDRIARARRGLRLAHERDVRRAETIAPTPPGGTSAPPLRTSNDRAAGKFGLASLCNLDRLPPTGSVVIAAPLKIVNGSGSPLRVLAIAPAVAAR
jgi:hypothetical protein